MSRKIFKYALELTEKQMVELPAGAKILDVQMQNGVPCLWAWVDPEEKLKRATEIYVFGTGNPIPMLEDQKYAYRHLGTVQDGRFVWHIFTAEYSPLGGEDGIN